MILIGDSGGPLIIPSMPDGNVSEGTPKLDLVVGIDLFGNGEGRCDGSSPDAFTSIGYFWGWILDIIDKVIHIFLYNMCSLSHSTHFRTNLQ